MILDPLLIVLAATALISWQANQRPQLKEALLYQPYRVLHHHEWYRLVSHSLVHGDSMHLFINLFVLWQFGAPLQILLNNGIAEPLIPLPGMYSFSMLYLGGVLFAAIPGMIRHSENPNYRSLGASGAVSAVLIAYILNFPTAQLLLFFVIPLPAFLAGALFFIYERQMDRRGQSRIAHDAHLWGGLFGLIFALASDNQIIGNFISAVSNYFTG